MVLDIHYFKLHYINQCSYPSACWSKWRREILTKDYAWVSITFLTTLVSGFGIYKVNKTVN